MRIAYLDCFSGVSGDMMLGALLDAGVNAELFRQTIAALAVDVQIKVETVDMGGISSKKVHVLTAEGERDDAHVVLDRHSHEHPHDSHADSDEHKTQGEHPEKHEHHHEHAHGHQPGRSWKEIHELISGARIDPAASAIALRAFRLLGEAEAKIHNIPIEQIHFHEVGAVDAIVDIVCTAVGCVSLGVERWVCSPLNVGGGMVKCAHGLFPVPAPATTELLKGAPIYSSGTQAELVTPTGAAIIRALGAEFAATPAMTIERTGYGAGGHDLPGIANVLRITIGETAHKEQSTSDEVVTVIETAVDDLSPQLAGYVMEKAFAFGALDVTLTPVLMKKNRPGQLFTVLCERDKANGLCDLLLRETTTLGVRLREEKRRCMQRKFATVSTKWGDVRVKLAYLNGKLTNSSPEFEDCRSIAEEYKIPLKIVLQEVIRLYREEQAAAAESKLWTETR
ncbi:MAG TPA: nickel pincer cofactor biosynthesis protein LarC [Terriglobales bacterium]|jgi:uncharacterized protein (TIGR00299 family) protein|nr:nickel pincer cofactor biosynthesis protein LarC [Terriglobales bacterium]